jgi:hypothetical protein
MMFSSLVVARTAPTSEDGVQLSGVKRPRILTVRIAREPAETSGAIEEPGPRKASTRLADDERGDKTAGPPPRPPPLAVINNYFWLNETEKKAWR